jgi:hypothetical protein
MILLTLYCASLAMTISCAASMIFLQAMTIAFKYSYATVCAINVDYKYGYAASRIL